MINSEKLIIDWLNSRQLGAKAYRVAPRSPRLPFITVERVGGEIDPLTDKGLFAIQYWAASPDRAAELADRTVEALMQARSLGAVGSVSVESTYSFPDPDSKLSRYQSTVRVMVLKHYDQ